MAAVYGYLIACILGSFILSGLAGAPQCVQDEMPNLQSCTSTFMSVMADMMGNAQNPPDQQAIMGAICSPEGKAAMMCSYQVMERCPALAQSGGGMGMMVPGVNMSEVMAMGGMDVMCGMMSGGQGECSGVQKCFMMMGGPEGGPEGGMMERNGGSGGSKPEPDTMEMITRYMTTQPDAFAEAKSYLFFQGQVGMVCGKMKPMMQCINKALEKCPAMKEQIDKQMSDMIKKASTAAPAGVKMMTFKEQQDFIKNECHEFPEGFAENKCLQDELMSSEFTECHKNFSATYTNKADMQTGDKKKCGATVLLQNCFKMYVQPTCGDSISSLMVTNLPLMVDGLDGQCAQYTSGSSTPMAGVAMLLMTAVTIMAAVLL